jgi:hypothetical protein
MTSRTPKRVDKQTQTTFACSDILAVKIQRRLRKRAPLRSPPKGALPKFHYKSLRKRKKYFEFYTGLTLDQFDHLFGVLERVGKVHEIKYWKGSKTKSTKKKNGKKVRKLSVKNQMMLCLMKLRQTFPNKDLAYKFDVSLSTVSIIINTWIQYLYKVTSSIGRRMFLSRDEIKKPLPASK